MEDRYYEDLLEFAKREYDYMKSRARLWKQAAKKWFHKGEVAEGLLIVAELALEKQRTIASRRLELLREGLEATKRADGHWSDRVRWMNWVEKVEQELKDAK